MIAFVALAVLLPVCALIAWAALLVKCDGTSPCDKSKCDTCPFPRCGESGGTDRQE